MINNNLKISICTECKKFSVKDLDTKIDEYIKLSIDKRIATNILFRYGKSEFALDSKRLMKVEFENGKMNIGIIDNNNNIYIIKNTKEFLSEVKILYKNIIMFEAFNGIDIDIEEDDVVDEFDIKKEEG